MESLRIANNKEDIVDRRTSSDVHNQRVVAFAPTLKDARLCQQILEQNNIAVCCCDSISSFVETILQGAGIALIAQEHLSDTVLAKLRDRMRQFEVRDLLLEKDLAQLNLRREARCLDMAILAGGMAAWEWTKTDMYWLQSLRHLYGLDNSVRPSQATMFSAIVEADRDRIVSEWSDAVEHHRTFRSEFQINHPQLGQRWLAAIGEPVKFKSGETVRYSGLQRDVTERKKWEMDLRQSQETFKRLIDDNPQGMYVVDADMRIRYASKGARNAFVNVRPLIGRPLDEAMEIVWPNERLLPSLALVRQEPLPPGIIDAAARLTGRFTGRSHFQS